PTGEGHRAGVGGDLYSRRVLAFATSDRRPTAELAAAALNMAAAARGGDAAGAVFHADRGSQYTSASFAEACRRLGAAQSMGRAGSALDNAAAESFFPTLAHELISRCRWATRDQARRDIAASIDTRHNPHRPQPTDNTASPTDHEKAQAARTNTPRFGGKLRWSSPSYSRIKLNVLGIPNYLCHIEKQFLTLVDGCSRK
ncbi:MAG: DDE-type integrase/transposase/recombinase, partial [bacterium]|nr:DDE-type integrase/transposase/recombinase [bacterium]